MPLRKVSDLEKTMVAASGVFRNVCSEEPTYHTAEELWEGLKHGDEDARLLFVFFLHLRKKERTRCSVEKAIAAEGKRWVGVLIEEAWHPYLLMRDRAVPYQGKPKSVVAIEGSRVQRRISARSGLLRYTVQRQVLQVQALQALALLMLQAPSSRRCPPSLCPYSPFLLKTVLGALGVRYGVAAGTQGLSASATKKF